MRSCRSPPSPVSASGICSAGRSSSRRSSPGRASASTSSTRSTTAIIRRFRASCCSWAPCSCCSICWWTFPTCGWTRACGSAGPGQGGMAQAERVLAAGPSMAASPVARVAVPAGRGLVARFVRDRLALIGLVLLVAFVSAALAAPGLTPSDPAAQDPTRRLLLPSPPHPLGTDNLGRDLLSRLLFGSRWSLGTAALATLLIMTIGVAIGAVAGYYGGPLDDLMVLVVDVLLAFPSLVLALAIAGTLGPGMVNVMLGLVSVWWVSYVRFVRGLVLSVRERQFVEAARCLGGRDSRIIARHVLPNVLPPVVVLASLEMGGVILAISGLSFLGLGAQPPTPEWGAMLNDGRPFLFNAPQLMIYPGLAISLVVIAFNLLGDGLRDVLDPRAATRR